MTTQATLAQAVQSLALHFPGPGGACAVLRDGAVLERHAWGWANAERRIAFTPKTLFRICSISKQFTCGLVLDAFPDPAILDGDVRARLPLLKGEVPDALHLCHNQSGLRDYWAVAMLYGAAVESAFGGAQAATLIGAVRTLQFTPGTRYSYCNQNFRMLSDILEQRSGRGYAEMLRTRIFDRVGMGSAMLAAETSAMPDGATGYEGTRETGFRAAVNNILWTGDAGIGASLDDMIAWERHIDATREDAGSLYQRLASPVRFADGALASYGFGLSRRQENGRLIVGHGGALRGWRSHRLHVASERLSVVVLFNHLSDAQAAAMALLRAALAEAAPAPDPTSPAPTWLGAYLDPETGLSARLDVAAPGQVRLRFGHSAETLDVQPDGSLGRDGTRVVPGADGLWMHRPAENQSARLMPCDGTQAGGEAGRYHCAELDADLTLVDAGGVLYGAFSGFLGAGRMEQLERVAADLWVLPCPRALDHTPPGDWTLALRRGASGAVDSIELGCWLARRLVYARSYTNH